MTELTDTTRLETMIHQQVVQRGIDDPRVLCALRAVPRERFFTDGNQDNAYADRPSDIGHGQTISQPYIVALMTHRLDVLPAHRVLEIGTGSGYQTAILAKIALEVFTIERVKPLLDSAWERLGELKIRNVHYRHGDGTTGWPERAPFDRILIAAGAPAIPEALLRAQLADGGTAVLPVGSADQQMLISIIRHGDRLIRTDICSCRFVPLVGNLGWPERE